jgi:hypothetical protein
MLRYLLTGAPLLALGFSICLAAQAQQQPRPHRPMPGMEIGTKGPSGSMRPIPLETHAPMGDVSGMMPPPGGMGPRVGLGQGLSGSLPIGANGIPQDGPRAGLPPMGLPDGHKKPLMPQVRPQYTPGGAMPAVPAGQP